MNPRLLTFSMNYFLEYREIIKFTKPAPIDEEAKKKEAKGKNKNKGGKGDIASNMNDLSVKN